MDAYNVMSKGGLNVISEKALPTVSAASTKIFSDVPDGCIGVVLDFTGGDLTFRTDGQVVAATTGIILRAALAPHILPYAQNTLKNVTAIGGSVTSGFVQYIKL